ncbi:MAG: phosphatidylserine decarboxylase family protein [Phycisphaeraceae bacterium]|nr:phosphatidylserine decarboxylase family protein [Phycisphaeraceae bacterium]
MLSVYGKREWMASLAMGVMLGGTLLGVGLWWLALPVFALTAAVLSFFRDPERRVPTQRGVVVSPADGRITSIHKVDHYEPFGAPAICIRVFLSVFNVHINRCPCHARIESVEHRPGDHLSALNPRGVEANESNLIVMVHPTHHHHVAAVRQVAGQFARTIVCAAMPERIYQRGQRLGMIKLGSTTELYLPATLEPKIEVEVDQQVRAGLTIMAMLQKRASDGSGAH